MRYVLHIVGWQPTRLNDLINCHWTRRRKLKRADADMIKLAVVGCGVQPPTRRQDRRRVDLHIVLGHRQRGGDPDAYWKSVLDGLVLAGALIDDRRQCVELGAITFSRDRIKATIITLTDIS